MLFNSIDFAIFLPIVFILYWFVTAKNLRAQNVLVVVASYVFYGWWDWRFLSLIIFSTILDYTIGVRFSKTEKPNARKFLIWISILVNLGFLGFFKYFNFFLDSFVTAFSFFGTQIHASGVYKERSGRICRIRPGRNCRIRCWAGCLGRSGERHERA